MVVQVYYHNRSENKFAVIILLDKSRQIVTPVKGDAEAYFMEQKEVRKIKRR